MIQKSFYLKFEIFMVYIKVISQKIMLLGGLEGRECSLGELVR